MANSSQGHILYDAICDGKDEDEVNLIIEKYGGGSFINVINDYGWTGFHTAAFFGNVTVLKKMMTMGSLKEIDKKDRYGKTALLLTAEVGKLQATQFLIGHGSSPNQVDNNNKNAKDTAREGGKVEVFEFLEKVLSKGDLFPLQPKYLNCFVLADDIFGLITVINEASTNQKV